MGVSCGLNAEGGTPHKQVSTFFIVDERNEQRNSIRFGLLGGLKNLELCECVGEGDFFDSLVLRCLFLRDWNLHLLLPLRSLFFRELTVLHPGIAAPAKASLLPLLSCTFLPVSGQFGSAQEEEERGRGDYCPTSSEKRRAGGRKRRRIRAYEKEEERAVLKE